MNLKSNRAITLVALIIAIIILLILAGVSLSMSMVLGENGLINKAQSSVDKYKEGSENDQNLLNQIAEYFDSKGLSHCYWSSSQCSSNNVWYTNFVDECVNNYNANNFSYGVRLSTTF